MKGICKFTRKECSRRNLWRRILQIQHPDFPVSATQDYEHIVRSFYGVDTSSSTRRLNIEDYKIFFVFHNAGRKLGTMEYKH